MKKELQRLFEEGDGNNDGILSLDEFQNIVRRVNPKRKQAEILKLSSARPRSRPGASRSPWCRLGRPRARAPPAPGAPEDPRGRGRGRGRGWKGCRGGGYC